jgi:hypothetical protein
VDVEEERNAQEGSCFDCVNCHPRVGREFGLCIGPNGGYGSGRADRYTDEDPPPDLYQHAAAHLDAHSDRYAAAAHSNPYRDADIDAFADGHAGSDQDATAAATDGHPHASTAYAYRAPVVALQHWRHELLAE